MPNWPCLRRIRALPSLWYGENLITADAVSPVTKVPDSVSLTPHTTTSPMYQNQSWISDRTPGPISIGPNLVYNSPVTHVPALDKEQKKTVHPDNAKQITVLMGRRHLPSTPMLPLIRSLLLLISQKDFTPHIENCHVLTLRRFVAKRAPANLVAWCRQ